MISYQVAQEFVAVARKPFRTPMTFEQIEKYWLTTLRPLLLVQFSPGLFLRALDLARRDQLSWYDSLIVAAAIQGDCEILYSEGPATWPSLRRSRCSEPFSLAGLGGGRLRPSPSPPHRMC